MIAMIMYYKEIIVMIVMHMVGLIRHAKYNHCLEESGQHSSMVFLRFKNVDTEFESFLYSTSISQPFPQTV